MIGTLRIVIAGLLLGSAAASATAQRAELDNGRIRAVLGPRGLLALRDLEGDRDFTFPVDGFGIVLDGRSFHSADLADPTLAADPESVTYSWSAGPYRLDVIYELRPGWNFVSKQIFATGLRGAFWVDSVAVFESTLARSPSGVFVPGTRYPDLGTADYGGALRFADGSGLLIAAQNPFLHFRHTGGAFSLDYAPDMEWRSEYGPFPADRGLLAPYRLAGRRVPATAVPEWRMAAPDSTHWVDRAEIEAFTSLVRAFLLYRPERPVDVYVAWTANDYQIDIATPAGREEYARMLGVVAEVGGRHVVFAPTNSALSRRVEATDYWSWENLLWLGLGQKIRRGEWDPRLDPVPPSVQAMLDYADSLGLSLMAYVYPVVPFSGDPEWLVRVGEDGRPFANLGVRSLQDWLVETLVAFRERTGISGYAFDHTFLRFPGRSTYAQWWGWRRVMEELRRRVPDIVIDGRQAYHLYGPWSWLAGSYPHPTMNDEQPESFVAFPDLHIDRVSANRQRFTAYLYRNHEFAPSEIMPGFMTHQTPRNDESGRMPQVETEDDIVLLPFRRRDWDYLGWRYSVISSIATAGWANVLSVLPGRDTVEYRSFSPTDKEWLRGWLEWTEENRELLRHTRTILGQPAIGKVDGTAAVVGDHGFVFLFNPNGRRLTARFSLDEAIGLTAGRTFVLRELHPVAGRRPGKPGRGYWERGDTVSITLEGGSARVLSIEAPGSTPTVFNAPGEATMSGDRLGLTGVRGAVGAVDTLLVALPAGTQVGSVSVNGAAMDFHEAGEDLVAVPVRFAGEPFHKLQPVWPYDPEFTGGTLRGRFTVPGRVLDQLARRQADEWPIPWDPEDFRSTWLAPQRLLLFVQIAEPDARWDVRLSIGGQPVAVTRAYSSVHPHRRTFVGFYADVSLLRPGREYEVELELPPLRAGQFQGLFFENVETEMTDRVAPPAGVPAESASRPASAASTVAQGRQGPEVQAA